MKNLRTREQFNAAVQGLVGLELAGVTYFEVEYQDPEPFYLHQPEIGHFLDHGVEFRMACGEYRSLLWDETFYQFGIGLFPYQAKFEVNTKRQWDVSNTATWKPILGSVIESAEVYWSWMPGSVADEEAYRTYFPQDIKLSFTCGLNVYISASEYNEKSDALSGYSDAILIIFDESVAKKYHVGPYAHDLSKD